MKGNFISLSDGYQSPKEQKDLRIAVRTRMSLPLTCFCTLPDEPEVPAGKPAFRFCSEQLKSPL